jgi:hypothetical protein
MQELVLGFNQFNCLCENSRGARWPERALERPCTYE